jgi:large subunit ribosomal protein L5
MAKNSNDSNPAGAGAPGDQPVEQAGQPAEKAGKAGKPAEKAEKAGKPADKAAGKAAKPAETAEKAGKPAEHAEKAGKAADQAGKAAEKAAKPAGKTPSAAAGKGAGGKPAAAPAAPAASRRERRDGYVPRLKRRYLEEVVPKLKREFGIGNAMAVPRLERVSLNMGMGEAIQNIKILDDAVDEMAALAGQRPTITRSQKSIAAFKLRAGMPIGCRVTLRGERMWEFLDRFISVALPRVRDFRGVSPKSFDGRGNYTMGIRDHLIFLEIDYNKVERPKGMNVTIVTTAGNDERALYLLRELGMPFAR